MSKKAFSPLPLRCDAVDALRGFAMLWMTAFHFCFDLNQFGYLRQNFYNDPVWTGQRTLIVSLFLFCAGMGQALAVAQGQSWPRFGRRWAQVLGCALLVTAGSWWMYPQSFIYFGVLHGIALMLLIVRLTVGLTVGWGAWLWGLGAVVFAMKFIAAYALSTWATGQFVDLLNGPLLNWLGLITRKPITEDYVPLLPWLGVMWWGVAAGGWLAKKRAGHRLWQPLPASWQWLASIGRWSLSYYMLHQPLLLGGFLALGWLRS